jgi:hypothetical protein
MSLAWATIAVLILLLPGFLFFVGIYVPEYFTRDVAPRSGLGQLAGTVLIAFLIHGLAFGLVQSVCDQGLPCIELPLVFSAVELLVDASARSVLADNVTQYRWWIFLYFSLTVSAGFLSGWFVGSRALSGGFWSFVVQHRWVHDLDLEDAEGQAITYAYVMTNIHERGRHLIYRGVLKQFALTREGTFAYLVLRKPRRSYMLLTAGQSRVMQDFHQIGSSATGIAPDSMLVIEGEDVANVVFEAKPYAENKEARSAVSEVVRKLLPALAA